MLENGFFHADPHAGNLLALPNGKLCYLDFGMVSSLSTLLLAKVLAYAVLLDFGLDVGMMAITEEQPGTIPYQQLLCQKVLTNAVLADFFGDVGIMALITEEQPGTFPYQYTVVVLPKVLENALKVDDAGDVEMMALVTEKQTESLLLVRTYSDFVVGWGATTRYEQKHVCKGAIGATSSFTVPFFCCSFVLCLLRLQCLFGDKWLQSRLRYFFWTVRL